MGGIWKVANGKSGLRDRSRGGIVPGIRDSEEPPAFPAVVVHRQGDLRADPAPDGWARSVAALELEVVVPDLPVPLRSALGGSVGVHVADARKVEPRRQ